jgi:GNAT superfamily N-acetyltransferase
MESTPRPIRVREILSSQDPSFEQVIQLYESSFPDDEREPTPDLRQSIDPLLISQPTQTSIRHMFVAERAGMVVGLLLQDYFPRVGLGWIIYLAIDPSERRSGLGTRLFQCGIASCRLDALFNQDEYRGVILEIERVEDSLGEAQRSEREKRMMFFNRLGIEKLTGTYIQPSLGEGLNPVKLNLFIAGNDHPLDPVAKRMVVHDFMVKMWGLPESDVTIEQALCGV